MFSRSWAVRYDNAMFTVKPGGHRFGRALALSEALNNSNRKHYLLYRFYSVTEILDGLDVIDAVKSSYIYHF